MRNVAKIVILFLCAVLVCFLIVGNYIKVAIDRIDNHEITVDYREKIGRVSAEFPYPHDETFDELFKDFMADLKRHYYTISVHTYNSGKISLHFSNAVINFSNDTMVMNLPFVESGCLQVTGTITPAGVRLRDALVNYAATVNNKADSSELPLRYEPP